MSQNESTTFLVTDAKNLTLIDATRENSPWLVGGSCQTQWKIPLHFIFNTDLTTLLLSSKF